METGRICVSPFWNASISWNTKDPYFSECFKHLILVIASCGVLWVVAPFEFIKICRYRGSPAPWSVLSITKIVCKVLLLIVCTIDLGKEIYAYMAHIKEGLDGLIAAVSFFVTIVLTVIITMMCKKRGLRSSIALPSFWMISTVTTLISIYDDIHDLDENNWVSIVSLVDDCFSFTISVLQLFLSNMPEIGTLAAGREITNYCPLEGSTLISRLTYSWLHGVLGTSTKKSLHPDDLIPLCSELRSTAVSNSFGDSWNISESFCFREDEISLIPGAENQENTVYLEDQTQLERKKIPLFKSLFKISSQYLFISAFFEIIYTVLYFLPVFILSLFLNNTEEPKWHFYVYAIALLILLLISTVADSQRKYYSLISAMKIKTAVMNAVFEKAFISQQFQNTEKYIKEDAENIFQMICLLNDLWGIPIRIILGVYLLWSFLGTSCFVGIGIASVLIPFVILVQTTAEILKEKSISSKSEWLNLLYECLKKIKCLKFYSWEDIFLQKIKFLRNCETKKLRKTTFLKIISKLIRLCSASLVSLAAFSYFVIVTDSFDMKIIFLSFALIYLLRHPFSNILRLLAHFVQGLSSISKVQSFLETRNVEIPQSSCDSDYGILIENATFAWESDNSFLLNNFTVKIPTKSLVAVVGESKSGKTSFLRAILGEMKKLAGSLLINGDVAYVSDTSWIQNATLEENILFGKPKLEGFYHNTLDSCDLLQDIENFPQADDTQIGEKGYPLNINQKQKVELARAVYQNAGIYLVDDIFRNTDESTAEQLFERVIGRYGILSNKIRIFTTSNAKLLPLVDYIIFMKDGEVVEQGEYSELLNKEEHFAEFLKTDYFSKYSRIETGKCITPTKVMTSISLKNCKRILDPWFTPTALSFKPDVNSFLQGEVVAAHKAFLKKILHYIQVNGYMITITAILTAALGNCCWAASLIWLAWNTSEYETDRRMHRDIYIFAGFILSEVTFFLLCGIIVAYGNSIAIQKFYKWLLNRIIKAPLLTYGTTFVEKVSESFDNDLQYVDEEIPVGIFIWLTTAFKFPVILVIIFLQSPILFLLLLYLIPLLYFVNKYYMNAWKQLHFLSASTSCQLYNFVENTFQGISNIRTSNRSSFFISQFRSKLDKHNKCHLLFMLVLRWMCNSIEIAGSIFVFLIVLVLIVHDEFQRSNSIAIALIFSLQASECLICFMYLSSTLDIDLSSLERLISFSNVKPEVEFENQISVPWLTSGSIIIRNLKTDLAERLYPVLNDISISIRPGEKVAIIGNEDSGTSTILDSIFRFREISEGQIFIDNVDVAHIRLHDLRSSLAIIPQDPLIFNSTLKENLDPEQHFTEEELQEVFKRAGFDSHLTSLNDTMHFNISDYEKHQIALARCLLKNPKIVIIEGSENFADIQHFESSTLILFGSSQISDGYNRIIFISSGEIVKVTSSTA